MKFILIILTVLCFQKIILAQSEIMNGITGSLFNDLNAKEDAWVGIGYQGRIVFLKNDHGSLTLGTRPSVGLQIFSFDNRHIGIDVPLTVDANWGAGSSIFNIRDIGLFLGTGVEYNWIKDFSSIYGPVIYTGLRYFSSFGLNEINFSYMIDVGDAKTRYITIGTAFIFD